MIRLVELSPAAGDALVKRLSDMPSLAYRRVGARFTFPQGDYREMMRQVSRHLDFVLAGYGQGHLIEDKYV